MSRALAVVLAVVVAWGLAGCEGVLPEFDWQQMIDQHKGKPFGESPFFADGRVMQPPPEHTVSRDRRLGHPELDDGVVDGRYEEHSPLPLTPALLATGRFAFDTYCAACHGVDGSGQSAVAEHMEQRKPPPLTDARVRAFPDGRIFQVASRGYGLMPAYELELSVRERWAVVAYLRALQLSRAVSLDELPPEERARADRALAAGARP